MNSRLKAYARSLYSVIKQYKAKGLMTAFLSGAEFSQLIKPIGTRPLILSAHPGDEILAIGGTMVWYKRLKVPLATLTFTAGRSGNNTGTPNPALGPRRKKEQIAAYNVIGGTIKPVFWDYDENFTVDQRLILTFVDLVDELNPDIIYAPSLLDAHPDNQAISRALIAVLQRLPSPRLKDLWIAQYELWTPIVPNKILNIDDFVASKQKAIECHESQLLCRDYLSAMLGLNRYRAAILGAGNVAEAYFVCRAPQYLNFLSREGAAQVIEMVS